MGVRRIIYACALAGSAFFFVLYPLWFSWYLFLLFLLLLPFDLLISLPGMLTRNITMYSPNILQSGDEGLVVITTHQKSHLPEFPARCVKLWIKVAGDDFTIWRRFVFGASGGSRQEVSIDTSRTGVTVFEVKRLWTVSLIGLVCLPANVNVSASVLVLPQPEKPPYTVALPRGVILRPKPGGGFSEDYDMRPYRLGDPIRSVHWKVSAKFDSLIIREPLIPPSHSRLLHAAQWSNAQERDVILARLRWVSDYLLKWEFAYYIRLGDDGPIAEVRDNSDLLDYLYNVLGGSIDDLPVLSAIPIRFAWVFRIDAGQGPRAREQGTGIGE